MWLLYVASDENIAKLLAPLTPGSEQAAKNLRSASLMIEQIGKKVGDSLPPAAHQMLVAFKDVSWNTINSLVHGGIHPLRRSVDGFPIPNAIQVLQSSNALSAMTGITRALLTYDDVVAKTMSKIQPELLGQGT